MSVSAAAALAVRYEDAACLVVDKPAGLLSVPGRGADKADCLSARVQARYADALVVHRLDMATSGLILFARGVDAQRTLSRAFAQRATHKRYVALVRGRVDGEAGEIDLPLAADWPNRPLQKVDLAQGRPSLTRWRVLARDASGSAATTRLALEPVTGRAHQLRVHLHAIGHPIVGDALYAPDDAPRLMLHATSLRFAHPLDGAPVAVESPAPF